MDYTAIIVALISLVGVIYQNVRNTKMVKRNDLKGEIKEIQKQITLISDGTKYELQYQLKQLCEKCIVRGDITATELKLISNMYHVYHDMHGNEFITDLYERCKELPMK